MPLCLWVPLESGAVCHGTRMPASLSAAFTDWVLPGGLDRWGPAAARTAVGSLSDAPIHILGQYLNTRLVARP